MVTWPLDSLGRSGELSEFSADHAETGFEQLDYQGLQLILDVAHNPAAALNLAISLQKTASSGRTFLLLAMMSDKDSTAMVDVLQSSIDVWYVVDLEDVPRALEAAQLARIIRQRSNREPHSYPSLEEGLRAVFAAMTDRDQLVVAGSFYLQFKERKQLTDFIFK